jgi:hypothetical protein
LLSYLFPGRILHGSRTFAYSQNPDATLLPGGRRAATPGVGATGRLAEDDRWSVSPSLAPLCARACLQLFPISLYCPAARAHRRAHTISEREGGAAVEQRHEGGRGQPDLRRRVLTPTAADSSTAPAATGGDSVRSSLGNELCRPVFSLCRPPRARPSPLPPSPALFSWRVISRGRIFLPVKRGIQPGVAWVETPSTDHNAQRRASPVIGERDDPVT